MVIFQNIIGFDGVIFILAIVTTVVFILARKSANELYIKMHPSLYVPGFDETKNKVVTDYNKLDEMDIVSMRDKMGRLYTLFANFTGIFPLMGILGTVISLIGLIQDMANAQDNFYLALTSTFWGLVFAIIFKMLDGFILSRIEDNEKTVALYLERNVTAKEKVDICEDK